MATIFATIFLGISFLAQQYHALPPEPGHTETVLSQIGRGVFVGRGVPYAILQAATATILVLAANTAYSDFPRLISFLARDRFLPRQLGSLAPAARSVVLHECRDLTQRLSDRLDFTRECELTLQSELGDVVVVRDSQEAVVAFALWHGVALAQGRALDELRILKLVAADLTAFKKEGGLP